MQLRPIIKTNLFIRAPYLIRYWVYNFAPFSNVVRGVNFYFMATSIHRNNGTNDKFYRKVAFLMYTEMFNFKPQSLKAASKPKPHQGMGTMLPSS